MERHHDQTALADVINRYCIEADRGRPGALFALFTEDADYQFGDRLYEGKEGVQALFAESGRRVKESGRDFGRVLHCVTTSAVELTDADRATGITYVSVLSGLGLDHFGRYHDDFVKIGDEWKIRRRKFVLDWAVPSGLGELLR